MADIILTVGFNSSSISQGIAAINAQFQRGFQPLGRITGAANEFKKSLEASNARVVAFGASAGAIYALRTAFSKLVGSAIEVEQSLTEINTLLQVSSKDLAKFSSDLFRVANAVGLSFSDAAKAAQEFARQGLSTEQVLQRTKSALTLTRLSGLALEDSVSSLTAALNSFGREALTDIEIVNRLANVDAKFAVSSADLAEALKRVAGSAADAGVEFNQVIALVTAAQQATARGGSVIGNSFKTIFTRLQRPQVLDDLEAAGVKVRGLNGESLSLITVLKNLSGAYDTLASGQKSFVAEAVGGVYQINVLKSILNDLGSGFGAYDRALTVAGESTSVAQRRMDALNNTISSRLVQTLNTLTKASAGAGEALFGQTIRSGLSGFERILNAKEKLNQLSGGDEDSGIGSFVGSSIGKGISNILSGPILQFALVGIIKLFQRLLNFVKDSVQDLTGVNNKEKERLAINQLVIGELTKQKTLLANLTAGTISVSDAAKLIADNLKSSNKELALMATFVPAISKALAPKITAIAVGGKNSAKGYIPSLNMVSAEIAGARDGGYTPGNVISTTVRDGMRSIPMIANAAESKTSVSMGGKSYDFINPPRNSSAGRMHAIRSKMQTGIDPYAADGFIPPLGEQRFSQINEFLSGLKLKLNSKINLSKNDYEDAMKYLASDSVGDLNTQITDGGFEGAFPFGRKKDGSIAKLLKKKGFKFNSAYGFIPNTGLDFKKGKSKAYVLKPGEDTSSVEGNDVQFFLKAADVIDIASKTLEVQHAGDGKLLRDLWPNDNSFIPFELAPTTFNQKLRNKEFGGRYSQSLKGVQGARETTELGKKAIADFRDAVGRTDQIVASKAEREFGFDPNDIKAMLNLRGREFAGLFAYKDFASKTPLTTSGETFGKTKIGEETYSVPFTYRGLKDPNPIYQDFKASLASGVSRSLSRLTKQPIKDVALSNEGQSFGIFFDTLMKNYANQLGLDTGARENENIDIVGFKKEIVNEFTSQAEFAAADAKGGFNQEAFDSIADKIARVLAFKKGSGIVTTPVFNDVSKFTGKNAGIFLSDNFTKGAKPDREGFAVALYKALATGKPFRTNIGSPRSNIFAASSGQGKYIKSADEVGNFDEYILVSTTKLPEKASSEIVGLTLGSSSDIVGYKSSKAEDTEHNDIFQTLQKRFGNRFKFGAKGFVPNLSTIQDALARENLATGGQAVLDTDPSLISSDNPLGLAAINKKTQGSARIAINQHKRLGQSMSSIKRAGSGYIPNLATDDGAFISNILLATIQSFGGSELPGVLGKLQKSFNNFIGQFDDFNKKSARKQGDWLETLDEAKKDLLLGNKSSVNLAVTPNTTRTKTFTKADDIDTFFAHQTRVVGDRLKVFSEALASEKKKIQNLGFKTAFIGGIGGGLASEIASGVSPDASKGIDQFVSGIQLGGQIIATFPNKVGKALGTFSIINGAIQGLDTFVKGIEGAKRQYEIQLSQSQKLAATFDTLGQSLANLDNMILDSTVTVEALNKEQRKYSEAVAKLSSLGPEGKKIANKIQQQPDARGKLSSLTEARALLGKNEESLAGLLQIKEVGDERSLFGKFSGASGGIFGYRTEVEKTKANQVLQNNAFSSISELDDETKDALVKNVSSGKFSELVNTAEPTKKVISSIREAGGTENDVKLFINQLKSLLGSEALNKDENLNAVRSRVLKANESSQFDVDTASRNELSFRRLLVNAGSLQAGNTLTNRRLNARGESANFDVEESRQKGKGNIIGQLFGEQTTAAFESQIAAQRIASERKQKVANANIQTSRSITDVLTQGLEGFVKPTDVGGRGPEALSPFKESIITAINTGISGSLKQGDFSRFIGSNGQLDSQAFEKSIVENSGATAEIQNKLSDFLSSNRSNLEVLKVIEQGNSELVEINQDAVKELQLQTVKLENLRKELDVKRQSNFLGGTRALTDRNFRREVNRQFIRGARLLETGQTPETRGRGALQILEAAKQYGLNPLKVANQNKETGLYTGKGDKFTDSVAKALNLAVVGLKGVNQNQENRIGNSINRLGQNSDAANIFNGIIDSQLKESAAGVAVGSTIKPEGDTIIQQAMNALEGSTTSMSGELDIAKGKLENFGKALDNIKEKLTEAIANREAAQARNKGVREAGKKDYTTAENEASQRLGLSPEQQAKDAKAVEEQRARTNKSNVIRGGLVVAGGIATLLAAKKAGSLFNRGKAFGSGALDAVVNEYGDKVRPTIPTIKSKVKPSSYEELNKVLNRQKGRAFKNFGPPASDKGAGLRDRLVFTSGPDNPKLGTADNKFLVGRPSNPNSSLKLTIPRPKPSGGATPSASGFYSPLGGGFGGGKLGGGKFGGRGAAVGGLAGFALSQAAGFLPEQKENDGLRSAASIGAFIPGGQFGFLGVKAGEAINDRFVGRYERQAESANTATSELLGRNPIAEQVLELRRLLDVNKGVSGFKNPESFKTRDKIVDEYSKQIVFLRGQKDLNKLDKDSLKPLFDELSQRIDDIRKGKDVSSEINVNLKPQNQNGDDSSSSSAIVPIKIEISIKDADKLPEIFSTKIIKPLEQQLKGLQNRTYNIEQSIGFTPQPAGI